MKNCIIAFLLGFDEIDDVIRHYSSVDASRETYSLSSVLNAPQDNDPTQYDIVTICRYTKPKQITPFDADKAKYSCCIIISLIEPFPRFGTPYFDIESIHRPAFNFVKEFLSRNTIQNWWVGLKLVIKHHSDRAREFVRFDPILLMKRMTPGSQQTVAEYLSRTIPDRIQYFTVPLDMLVTWIIFTLPDIPKGPNKFWEKDNPLRITMGGCYAGGIGISKQMITLPQNEVCVGPALIKILAERFKIVLEQKNIYGLHIEIVGAITWTFRNDFRALSSISLFEIEKPDEGKRYFVKAPSDMRRCMTRVSCLRPSYKDPNQYESIYGYRPEKNNTTVHMEVMTHAKEIAEMDLEAEKVRLSNQTMLKFLSVAEKYGYKRVPPDMSEMIQNLGRFIYQACDLTHLTSIKTHCAHFIHKRQQQLGTQSFEMNEFLVKLLEIF